MEIMPISRFGTAALVAAATVATGAPAGVVGKDADVCEAGRPAVLVRVSGFKRPSGRLKVILYDGDGFLAKGGKLNRVTVPVQSLEPIDVCVAAPGPGRYAVVVHHDVNGDGGKDLGDGGGYSRNPRLALTNLKVPFARAAVEVGRGPLLIPIQLQYRKGLSIGPVA